MRPLPGWQLGVSQGQAGQAGPLVASGLAPPGIRGVMRAAGSCLQQLSGAPLWGAHDGACDGQGGLGIARLKEDVLEGQQQGEQQADRLLQEVHAEGHEGLGALSSEKILTQ